MDNKKFDIERMRGFLMMMRKNDKVALTGGGLTAPAMDRPSVDSVDYGDELLPYGVSEPMQLALGCTFSPEVCESVARAKVGTAAMSGKGAAFAGTVRAGLIRDPMSVSAGEFFSEDAVVTAELLKCFTDDEGLGFVFTDILGQGRFTNRTIDARALRELYLLPLARAGKTAAAIQLDGGYLNDEEVCTSQVVFDLITDKISPEAAVFTQYLNDTSKMSLLTTGAYVLGADNEYRRRVNSELNEKPLNRSVERTLAASVYANNFYKSQANEIVRASEYVNTEIPDLFYDSTVMLKNDGTLPTSQRNLTVFGDAQEFEDGKRYALMPVKTALKNYGEFNVFMLTGYEEKGIDREDVDVICAVAAKKPTVVLLCGCCATPVIMSEKINALLFCPQRPRISEVMKMLTDADKSPRGRLPFTWCKSKSSYPCNNQKFMSRGDFRYESMYNGYLLFNNYKSDVQYPFGHGLEYTKYDISKLSLTSVGTQINAEFVVKNVGEHAGYAVCQLYITLVDAPIYGFTKRLAAFKRVPLERGESESVTLSIDLKDFEVYDETYDRMLTVGGKYRVEVGLSSVDIRTSGEIKIAAGSKVNVGVSSMLAPVYYLFGKGRPFEPNAPEVERLLKVPFIKKTEDRPDIAPPAEHSIKKALKAAEKSANREFLPLLRHKIKTTPERNKP